MEQQQMHSTMLLQSEMSEEDRRRPKAEFEMAVAQISTEVETYVQRIRGEGGIVIQQLRDELTAVQSQLAGHEIETQNAYHQADNATSHEAHYKNENSAANARLDRTHAEAYDQHWQNVNQLEASHKAKDSAMEQEHSPARSCAPKVSNSLSRKTRN